MSHSPYILGDTTRHRRITCVQVWSKSDQRWLTITLHKQADKQTDTTKIMVTWPWTNSNTSCMCPDNMINFDPLTVQIGLGHPCKFQWVSHLGSVTARHSSSGHQPNFVALNRGRHLYSAGRPSRWALAHILVFVVLYTRANVIWLNSYLFTYFWCASPCLWTQLHLSLSQPQPSLSACLWLASSCTCNVILLCWFYTLIIHNSLILSLPAQTYTRFTILHTVDSDHLLCLICLFMFLPDLLTVNSPCTLTIHNSMSLSQILFHHRLPSGLRLTLCMRVCVRACVCMFGCCCPWSSWCNGVLCSL